MRALPNVKTITYMQNAHLIKKSNSGYHQPFKDRLKFSILRRFIKRHKANTDLWVFQTKHICEEFVKSYAIPAEKISVLPYYDADKLRSVAANLPEKQKPETFVYLSEGYPHKNHLRLLEAWEILRADHSLTPELHLTVEEQQLKSRIEQLVENGCRITNHGVLPRETAVQLASECEFTIFPSLLETVGLGLLEGAWLGTKIICSNSKAFSEIILPTSTFDPLSPASIANSVAKALSSEKLENSKPLLENRISELIDLLCE